MTSGTTIGKASQKHQVYLVYSAKEKYGERMFFHLLMWPSGGQWKAADMLSTLATIGGIDAEQAFVDTAQEEKAGRNLVALSLYTGALKLAAIPAYRTSGRQRRFRRPYTSLYNKLGLPK